MRILIIGPSWVGDSVMAQSLYILLKEEDPDCMIDVISPKWTLPVLERMPQISEKISSPFSHGEVKLRLRNKLGKSLKKLNYDRSIVLTNSFKSALIPFFAKIPVRTGWLGEMRYGLLNDIRKTGSNKNYLMVEKFASLSFAEGNFSLKNLSFPSLNVDLVNQRENLTKFRIHTDLQSLAICPGAEFGPSKKWPAEYYAEVAKTYVEQGWNVFCLGSINDQETGKKIQTFHNLDQERNFHNLIGKTSLNDAVDLLAHCEKVVTNDSGLMHVSAAVGTSVVAVYGPSSPDYTPPLINKRKILRKTDGYDKTRVGNAPDGYHNSLLAIKPNEVIDALEEL